MIELEERNYARGILQNYISLVERRFLGDMVAIDTLIDLERAIELAELTERQKETIYYRYMRGFSPKESAEKIGIARTTLVEHEQMAINAINEVYIMWAYMEGVEK